MTDIVFVCKILLWVSNQRTCHFEEF